MFAPVLRGASARASAAASAARLPLRLPLRAAAPGRSLAAAAAAVKDLGPADAHSAMQAGQRYLDVRTAQEFGEAHPPGALNVPVRVAGAVGMSPNPKFVEQVAEVFPDMGEAILVGCHSGARSAAACQLLSEAGYTDLTNVAGGRMAWEAAGLPLQK